MPSLSYWTSSSLSRKAVVSSWCKAVKGKINSVFHCSLGLGFHLLQTLMHKFRLIDSRKTHSSSSKSDIFLSLAIFFWPVLNCNLSKSISLFYFYFIFEHATIKHSIQEIKIKVLQTLMQKSNPISPWSNIGFGWSDPLKVVELSLGGFTLHCISIGYCICILLRVTAPTTHTH